MVYAAKVDAADPNRLTGWVASMEDGLGTAIVCHHIGNEWVPQYGLKRDGTSSYDPIPLPACFTLDAGAIDALDEAYKQETSV